MIVLAVVLAASAPQQTAGGETSFWYRAALGVAFTQNSGDTASQFTVELLGFDSKLLDGSLPWTGGGFVSLNLRNEKAWLFEPAVGLGVTKMFVEWTVQAGPSLAFEHFEPAVRLKTTMWIFRTLGIDLSARMSRGAMVPSVGLSLDLFFPAFFVLSAIGYAAAPHR